MKRNRLFNKIISLSLIFALYFSMSASAFAELETDTESVNNETVSEEVKVEESATEMHSDESTEANEVATGNESVDNQQNMNADKQNQTASEPSNEGGVVEQVITPIVEEIKEAVNEIIGDKANSEESEEDQLEAEEDKALEEEEHRRLAKFIADVKADKVILVGRRTKQWTAPELKKLGVSAVATTDPRKALDYIETHAKGGETLIFKGSQYLEWIIEKLLLHPEDAAKLCRREKAAVARRKSWGLE